MGEPTEGPWCRDGHNMSSVLKCVRSKDDPKAKHVCGDYITIAEGGRRAT